MLNHHPPRQANDAAGDEARAMRAALSLAVVAVLTAVLVLVVIFEPPQPQIAGNAPPSKMAPTLPGA